MGFGLPQRFVSYRLRFGSLLAAAMPVVLGLVMWLEWPDITENSLGSARDNLLTGIVIAAITCLLMVWRSFAMRLVITENGVVIGNYLTTHRLSWESISAVMVRGWLEGEGASRRRMYQARFVVMGDTGRRSIAAIVLTKDSPEEFVEQPAMRSLRAAAPMRLKPSIVSS